MDWTFGLLVAFAVIGVVWALGKACRGIAWIMKAALAEVREEKPVHSDATPPRTPKEDPSKPVAFLQRLPSRQMLALTLPPEVFICSNSDVFHVNCHHLERSKVSFCRYRLCKECKAKGH